MNEENNVDDNWEISSVGNFIYKKNAKNDFYINSQIIYKNISTQETKKENRNLDVLFNKVVGNVYNSNDKILLSNCEKNSEKLIFEVSQSNLNKSSKMLRHYEEFNLKEDEIPSFETEFLIENKLSEKLHYTSVHLLKSNNDNNEIDFYILTSYEVLRYFFLKGSKLNKFFFQKFLFSNKNFNDTENELFIKREILQDDIKRHFLITKQGFSTDEYSAIYRMAFIKNGFNCIEKIRKSLLINSTIKDPFAYRTLYTYLPQDYPFKILCSGKRFNFKNKKYFLVDEIHDTQEHFPIKDVELHFFADRRKNQKNNENSNVIGTRRLLNSSKPMQNTTLTSKESGNSDNPANIEVNHFNNLFFEDKEDVNLTIVDKLNGDDSYNGTVLNDTPQAILSLLSEIDKNSNNGRATTTSVQITESEITIKRREIFYNAIKAIRSKKIIVDFFYLDSEKVLTLTNDCVLVENNIKDNYKTILCQVKILEQNDPKYIYVVRCDGNEHDTSRYAYLNKNLFEKHDFEKVKQLYEKYFKKEGLRFKTENLKSNEFNLKNSLVFHNQSDYTFENLSKKIKLELERKIKSID